MSPEEIGLLKHAGSLLIGSIIFIVAASVLYGLYLTIFAFGIRALLKRNPWTKYTWTLFGLLSILFIILTGNLVTNVAANIGLIRGGLINNADWPLMDRFILAGIEVEDFNIAGFWLAGPSGGGFLFVFADAVVVWRAWVLWPGHKIAKALPLILLFASLGSSIVSTILESIAFAESGIVPTSTPAGIMLSISQSLSLATNIVATTLIGYKAYYHRQMMTTSMGVQSSLSGTILVFLTESGVVFCVLQLIALVTSVPDNKRLSTIYYVAGVCRELTMFAAASYPILVLIIVDNHRSISDHTQGSAADSRGGEGPNV